MNEAGIDVLADKPLIIRREDLSQYVCQLALVHRREFALRPLLLLHTADPKDAKAHFELGRAYRQAGQTERAKQEFAVSQTLYASHSQE